MVQANHPTRSKRRVITTLLCAILATCCTLKSATAQDLLGEDPHDLITVADASGNTTLKVLPLPFPNRRIPNTRRGSIRVRLLNQSDEEFDVQWSAIKKIELYEQRIIGLAGVATKKKEYDDAFKYLSHLRTKYPKTPGLDDAMQRMLTAEATDLFRQGEHERAWFLLNEIYSLNPKRPGLDRALTAVLDRLFAKRIAKRDFVDARRIYGVTEDRYGRSVRPLLQKWRTQLERYALKAKERSEKSLTAGKYADAYRTGQMMMEIWPDTTGGRELFAKLAEAYPIVRVAVTQPFAEATDPMNARSARRCERLLHRSLFEMIDVGSEGGEYICPLGTHRISPDGVSIDLSLSTLAKSQSSLSGLTIARQLRAMALPVSKQFSTEWWAVFDGANAKSLFDVSVQLTRPHLRFESVVDDALSDLESVLASVSPYEVVIAEPSKDATRPETRFRENAGYLLKDDKQPSEIEERFFTSSESSLSALRRGEVDVIARLLPADAVQALRDKSIETRPYRVPSTHMLIPNFEDEFVGQRAYRFALLYAIDRETILSRELLGGGKLNGCEVVSGPFPKGLRNDDPLSYGYNRQITPRGYDPRLAKVRMQLAHMQASNAAQKAGDESAPTLSKIILAHPDDEVARLACQHIANNWRIIGLEVELVVIPPGKSVPDTDWHFTYADLRIAEPLTDASRLLSSSGFAKCSSPYLNLALRQLRAADNWNDAGTRLRAVHQICYDDVSILPLWQLADYYAHGPTVDGIGTQPVSLYQNVEQWRVIPQ